MKVTIVLGLCGSGKSYYCRNLHAATRARIFEHVASQPDTRAQLLQHLSNGNDAIVEEVTYCRLARRCEFEVELAAIKGLEIVYVCFENDWRTANWNVLNRTDKRDGGSVADHLANNVDLAQAYSCPPGVTPLPIHRIPQRPDSV